MAHAIDRIGQRFGKLVVTARAPNRPTNPPSVQWLCRCDCGNDVFRAAKHLVGGKTGSCGCASGEKNKTHGATKTPEFRAWSKMICRCHTPGSYQYADYGGRGIQVCERWHRFENFLADMGSRPSPAHSIDRFPNNNGNYEPGNCRWATDLEQQNNRRNTKWLAFDGQRKTITEWARIYGTTAERIQRRIDAGWPIDQALMRPKSQGNRSDLRTLREGGNAG